MDITNLGAELSIVQAHLRLFAFLLLALPATSIITIKFWLATRSASNVQRKTQWEVPPAEDSEGMNSFFDHESVPRAISTSQLRQRQKLAGVKN
jgi:hypothetical protein